MFICSMVFFILCMTTFIYSMTMFLLCMCNIAHVSAKLLIGSSTKKVCPAKSTLVPQHAATKKRSDNACMPPMSFLCTTMFVFYMTMFICSMVLFIQCMIMFVCNMTMFICICFIVRYASSHSKAGMLRIVLQAVPAFQLSMST